MIIAAFAIAVGATAVWVGPDMASVAVSGVMVGLFGSLFGDRIRAAAAAGTALGAIALGMVLPDWVSFAIAIPVMAALVGRETDRAGSKTFVFGLMAWIILLAPANSGDGWTLIAVFVAAAAFGIGVAIVTGVEARIPAGPHLPGYGLSLGIVVAAGLALAFFIAGRFDGSHTQWVALLFAARALDAPDAHLSKAVRTALGAMAGAAAAGALLVLPLPSPAFAVVGMLLFVLGLRLMPAKTPLSPALTSAAVILGTASDQASAVFRVEAAAIAAGLVVALIWSVGALRARFFEGPEHGAS